MTRHLLLVPSTACPASCSYCFGPHMGGSPMGWEVVEKTARWMEAQPQNEPLEITFHGGEPLLAGADYYRKTLPRLERAWQAGAHFSAQSNLWPLTGELCEIFQEHGVSLGTSLDGPEEINDYQRGKGYFRRTMAGIELARSYSIPVGCIVTFTAQSIPRWREVVEFFAKEGLSFSIHAALPVMDGVKSVASMPWKVSADSYGALLMEVFDYYTDHLKSMRVPTLDAICRSLSAGKGGICTFGDCLGGYLAVGPDGVIYPCQRFVGMERYRLGDVADQQPLEASAVWREFSDRQDRIAEVCSGCSFLDICRGGCPYNALAAGGEGFAGGLRDPYCAGYKKIFEAVTERAAAEVFSESNLAAVVNEPRGKGGFLRHGAVLGLLRGDPHPSEAAQHARQTLAVTALAASASTSEAAERLRRLGFQGRQLESSLEVMKARLENPRKLRNNIYLHVTFACTQRCSHCYARAGEDSGDFLPLDAVVQAVRDAALMGFRHAVITGGEPLLYRKIDELLDEMKRIRALLRPLKTVLRTSLAQSISDDRLRRIADGCDEVVVSLDGDEITHDERRGAGSYGRSMNNLRRLVALKGEAEVSLACVLPLPQTRGAAGESVRAVAKELGIRRVRFRPVLPLGRAACELPDVPTEAVWASLSAEERIAYGFLPTASCGIGQNLYIEPDGAAYPCYAWHGPQWQVGNLIRESLGGLLENPSFQALSGFTVNTNLQCQSCPLRYLCGGACRAWNRLAVNEQIDLNAPPADCRNLHQRARELLMGALKALDLDPLRWLEVGLPIPETPPKI